MTGDQEFELELPSDYGELLAKVKQEVRSARVRAARVINSELIEMSIDRTTARLADNNWAIGFTGRVGPGHEH